jgi:hypothetical protein
MPLRDAGAVKAEMADELEALLRREGLSMNALARSLTERAQLGKYDAATVKAWLRKEPQRTGKGYLPISRQAAWLLDTLYGPGPSGRRFQELRDEYVLTKDREGAPQHAGADIDAQDLDHRLVEGSVCYAEVSARRLPRSSLTLPGDVRSVIALFTVVDCSDARRVIHDYLSVLRRDATRPWIWPVGMYHVLGRWDLLVKLAVEAPDEQLAVVLDGIEQKLRAAKMFEEGTAEAPDEFGAARRIIAREVYGRLEPQGVDMPPRHLRLPHSDDYDRYRLQRAFLVVDQRTTDPENREGLRESVFDAVFHDSRIQRITESLYIGDDAFLFELIMSCAIRHEINYLNRKIEDMLSIYRSQKYNLLAYAYDEPELPSQWERPAR